MAIFKIRGRVTKDGKLDIELPPDLPAGEVNITIEPAGEEIPWEERPWTSEEIAEFLNFEGKTGIEIAEFLKEMGTTGWEDIQDSVLWVEEQRRKRDEERNHRW